jgi:hypothetical protein
MSALVYAKARTKVRSWEGGYSKGFKGSGETYRGIDRIFNPTWPGWTIIDKIPNKQEHQYFNNPTLEKMVDDWHEKKYWIPSQAAKVNNEELSIFFYDFYFHKPLQAVVAASSAAKELNKNLSISNNTLTAGVLSVMNANPAYIYKRMWDLRELHYKNKWLNRWSGGSAIYTTTQKGVLNRLYSFGKTISVGTSAKPTTAVGALLGTGTLKKK